MAYAKALREQAVRLAEADVSDREISTFLGVPVNTVINWRIKAKIVRDRNTRLPSVGLVAPTRPCTVSYVLTDEYGRPAARTYP